MRPRRNNRHLPPCVYLHHGAYYLVSKGRWQRLGADLPSALAEYGRRFSAPQGSMAKLIDDAIGARRAKLSSNTWDQYQVVARKLKEIMAEFAPEQVLPRHVVQIRQSMAATPNMANRTLSVLRLVFDYALERQLIDSNPAVGIKRLEERERDRLITRAEYQLIYAKAPPRLQVVMDLCFFTGQRISDVLGIRYAELGDEGITFRQAKTGARLLVRWTDELRAVVERAKALHGNVRALTLLHNRRGKSPDYKTVRDQWTLACSRAGVEDAHLHDLRAMAGTAAEEQGLDPQQLLGHTSPAMTRRYLRAKKTPKVDGPSFSQVLATLPKRSNES